MKFIILSRLPEIYSTRRLVQEIQVRGHELSVLNPEENLGPSQGDILIPRIGSFRYDQALKNLENFALTHPYCRILNPPTNFHQARHKKSALEKLQDLPQPKLFPSETPFPVVVKDCLSSQGEGVFLCHNQAELEACRHKLQGRELLYQEFISESRGRDVRVFVIGGEVAASMERISANPAQEFRSNLSLGGRGTPAQLTAEEIALCLAAVNKLGLDYAGVDMVRSQRGPLLLEVNPCPGLEGIENSSGQNLARDLVVFAEKIVTTRC